LGEGRAAIVATKRSADGWLPGGRVGLRALTTLCVVVSASTALALPATRAEAKPKQTLKEAEAKLKKLNSQVDHQDDVYNKAKSERQAAEKKLSVLNKSVAADKKTYDQLRARVAQLAAAAYKNGGDASDIPSLVSAKDPQTVLDQISIFTQVTQNRSAEVTQFLNAAQLLQRQQAQARQAADDLASKAKSEKSQRDSLRKSVAKQQGLVDKLGGGSSSSNGPIGGTYTGKASGNVRKVLEWAYSKLGTPYEYGGTGPRYDCSGFVMVAWKQGGVSLPRVVPDQMAATHRVAKADLQEGDLVFFDNNNHVGIFVGGGKFIHSPSTGDVVKISSLSDSWYASKYYGAGRV
jgi:cell wall-associated NlpC family hydrolase